MGLCRMSGVKRNPTHHSAHSYVAKLLPLKSIMRVALWRVRLFVTIGQKYIKPGFFYRTKVRAGVGSGWGSQRNVTDEGIST